MKQYPGDVTNHWVYQSIRQSVERLYAGGFEQLSQLDQLPTEIALQIAATLLEGCYNSTNTLWIQLCRWKFWQIPRDWLLKQLPALFSVLRIDWADEYETGNLLVVFQQDELLLKAVYWYAKEQCPMLAPDCQELLEMPFRERCRYFEQTMEHIRYLGLE